MKTEKEKMLLGEKYFGTDTELVALRANSKIIMRQFNENPTKELAEKLFAQKLTNVVIEPPIYVDYGNNIEFGENVFINFGCTILDCAKVKLGDNVFIGPNVQIYTPCHPINPQERNSEIEWAEPITIEKDCWIGGGAIILPGVTIGEGCTIGAGSVVSKDIPAHSLAVGNPCKVIRKLK